MANIKFNNTEYNIDDSALSAAKAELQSHLSTVMNGSGAAIKFGGSSYNIDATKLATATNELIAHFGTISGTGTKISMSGTEYSVDSAKLTEAISELGATLGELESGEVVLERLSAPTIALDGDTLNIFATDENTESYAILVDGKEKSVIDRTSYKVDIDAVHFCGDIFYYKVNGGEWNTIDYSTEMTIENVKTIQFGTDTSNCRNQIYYYEGTCQVEMQTHEGSDVAYETEVITLRKDMSVYYIGDE